MAPPCLLLSYSKNFPCSSYGILSIREDDDRLAKGPEWRDPCRVKVGLDPYVMACEASPRFCIWDAERGAMLLRSGTCRLVNATTSAFLHPLLFPCVPGGGI